VAVRAADHPAAKAYCLRSGDLWHDAYTSDSTCRTIKLSAYQDHSSVQPMTVVRAILPVKNRFRDAAIRRRPANFRRSGSALCGSIGA
jgi:hypothetical protein